VPSHQHEDFNPLLDTLLRFAKKCLAERNAFLPFAAMMSADGEVSHVAGHMDDQRPGAPKVLQLLEGTLRGMAKKHGLRAAGICVDIRFASSPEQPKGGDPSFPGAPGEQRSERVVAVPEGGARAD
jgi:hypothetical protein